MAIFLAAFLALQERTPEDLIKQLHSDSLEIRNQAYDDLKKRGESILPALEQALGDSDPNVVRTCKELSDGIKKALALERARGAFERLEASLIKSNTVRLKIREQVITQFRGGDLTIHIDGTLLFKEGNRANVAITETCPEEPALNRSWSFVIDGKQLRGEAGRQEIETIAVPPNYVELFMGYMLRLGPSSSCQLMNGVVIRGPKREKPYEVSYSPNCDASSVKVQMRVPFSLNVPEAVDLITCTLTYDERSGKLATQNVSRLPPGKLVPSATTIVYDECTFNKDIPDEKFELPK